jgi:uncharacterized RDD family membrane protein YckC
MPKPEICRWIRSDGTEVEFADRGALLRALLAGEIPNDALVRTADDGPWIKAAELRRRVEAAVPGGEARTPSDRHSDQPTSRSQEDKADIAAGPEDTPGGPRGGEEWVPASAPWRRYLARHIDLFLAAILVTILMGVIAPDIVGSDEGTIIIWIGTVLVAFPLMDAVFLARWGASPGKWSFSVRTVQPSGERLGWEDALGRAYGVIGRGTWFSLPFLAIIPLLGSYRRATDGTPQPWERSSGTRTEVQPIGGKLALVVVASMLVLVVGARQWVATTDMGEGPTEAVADLSWDPVMAADAERAAEVYLARPTGQGDRSRGSQILPPHVGAEAEVDRPGIMLTELIDIGTYRFDGFDEPVQLADVVALEADHRDTPMCQLEELLAQLTLETIMQHATFDLYPEAPNAQGRPVARIVMYRPSTSEPIDLADYLLAAGWAFPISATGNTCSARIEWLEVNEAARMDPTSMVFHDYHSRPR